MKIGFYHFLIKKVKFYCERIAWLGRQAITPGRRITFAGGVGLAIGTIAVTTLLILYGWYAGETETFSVARYFPVSDALAWRSCAASLAATGQVLSEWCTRRVLYPAWLATVLVASGWYSQIALLIQAAFIGLAILTISIEVARLLGWLTATIVIVILGVFAWEFAFSQFMSEAIGFSLGLAGAALLLRFIDRRRQALLLSGIALISLGLSARAGALLILPVLVLWGYLMRPSKSPREKIKWVSPIVVAALFGPLLQIAVLTSLGIDPRNTGGNFAPSLYALSKGSHDWKLAYQDLPHLWQSGEAKAFRQLYPIALDNIREHPFVFAETLWQSGQHYVETLFIFGDIAPFNTSLKVLMLVGVFVCAYRWQEPLGSLLLFLAAAELVSAPIIMDSGGNRLFAASIIVRALLVGVGFQTLVSMVVRCFKLETGFLKATEKSPLSSWPLLPLGLGGVILLGMLLPITPLVRPFRLDSLEGLGCPPGQTEVVTRLDRESLTLGIVASHAETSLFPYRIMHERLISDSGLSHIQFCKDFIDLPANTVLIQALQRLEGNFGTRKLISWAGELPMAPEATVSLCLDNTQSISLCSHSYVRAVTMKPLKTWP